MSFTQKCCCYSFRGLEELCGPALDVYLSINNLKDVKYAGAGIITCLGCRQFLKEVHRFRIEANEVDEASQNNLDIKPSKDQLTSNIVIDENSTKTSPECRLGNNKKNPKKHNNERYFYCDHCNFCSNYKQALSIHMRSHTKVKPYKCSKCSYETSTSQQIKQHIAYKHSNEWPFSCDQCNNSYKRKDALIAHKRTHLKGRSKRHKCRECIYTSTNWTDLNNHLLHKHNIEKPFACDQCDHRCKTRGLLFNHQRVHNNGDFSFYKCNDCSYLTDKKQNLKNHISYKHNDVKPFCCDLCDYRGKKKTSLFLHMRTHMDVKPFKCVECSFSTVTTGRLSKHVALRHPSACVKSNFPWKLQNNLRTYTKKKSQIATSSTNATNTHIQQI